MSEEIEYVEVTVKVPKRLMEMLEAENYFGWKKEDFFSTAVKTRISCEINELDIDELNRIHEKYGRDIDVF